MTDQKPPPYTPPPQPKQPEHWGFTVGRIAVTVVLGVLVALSVSGWGDTGSGSDEPVDTTTTSTTTTPMPELYDSYSENSDADWVWGEHPETGETVWCIRDMNEGGISCDWPEDDAPTPG